MKFDLFEQFMIGGIVVLIGISMLIQFILYKEGIGSKQFVWMLYSVVVGGIVVFFIMLGGFFFVRVVWYIVGVVGGQEKNF